MKLEGSVTQVEDIGDRLRVTLQACGVTEPECMPLSPQSLEIPATDRNRRTFWVGRYVTIEMRPA